MKKIRYYITSLLLTVACNMSADNLAIADISVSTGEEKQLKIELVNPTGKYISFQFDLVLPEGVFISKDKKGNLKATLDDKRADGHTLNVEEVGNGVYRFVSFSMPTKQYSKNSGPLVYVTIVSNENLKARKSKAAIKIQKFTDINYKQHRWEDVYFFIVNNSIHYMEGDINFDDEVDVTDVVELIDMVLAGINDPIGDINGDGEVDVTDVVELIDMVLAGG